MTEPFQSISEVSANLGVPAHTLRYWEREFHGVIKPTTGAGGRRYYRVDTVATLTRIRELLYDNGYTIAGVKKLIASGELMDGEKPKTESRKPKTETKSITQSLKPVKPDLSMIEPEIDRAVELLTLAKHILN